MTAALEAETGKMKHTQDYGNGFAGDPFAGLLIPASAGLVELVIATGNGLVAAARGIARIATKVAEGAAKVARVDAEQAPHITLLRVPGEFVAGTWRRV